MSCIAKTKAGRKCLREATKGNFCWQHRESGNDNVVPEPPEINLVINNVLRRHTIYSFVPEDRIESEKIGHLSGKVYDIKDFPIVQRTGFFELQRVLFKQYKIAEFILKDIPVSSPGDLFVDGETMRKPTPSEIENKKARVCLIAISEMTAEEKRIVQEMEKEDEETKEPTWSHPVLEVDLAKIPFKTSNRKPLLPKPLPIPKAVEEVGESELFGDEFEGGDKW